jgi:polygalacturonase
MNGKKYFLFIVIVSIFYASSKGETYNIKDFGAVGDGKTINTFAIQNAINKCRDAGGGIVLIPSGTFISGTIQLFSNINLHLESGLLKEAIEFLTTLTGDSVRLGLSIRRIPTIFS